MLLKLFILLFIVMGVTYVLMKILPTEKKVIVDKDISTILEKSESIKEDKESLRKNIDSIKNGLNQADDNLNN